MSWLNHWSQQQPFMYLKTGITSPLSSLYCIKYQMLQVLYTSHYSICLFSFCNSFTLVHVHLVSHRSFCSELLSIPCPVYAYTVFLLGVDRNLNASLTESHPTFLDCFLSLSRSWQKDKTAKERRQSRNHFPLKWDSFNTALSGYLPTCFLLKWNRNTATQSQYTLNNPIS